MKRENPGGDAIGTLLMLGGMGALAYYGYSQGWFSAFLGSPAGSPAVGTNLATGQPSSTGTQTQTQTSTGSPAAPTWAGPSLDQIFQNLLAAEQAAMSASSPDTALTCAPGASSGSNMPIVSVPGGQGIATNPNGPHTAAGQNYTPTYTQSALSGLGAVSCSMPVATYDVHNWYLMNRSNSGIATAPDPPDHTSQISLSDYWTWAAPLLKAANPGLAGGFGRGLGAYAELGRLMRMQRGY